MKITASLTIVPLPVRDQEGAAWAQSAEFLADKVVLQGGMYARLFGGTLSLQRGALPWRRGVVRIRVVTVNGTRTIRRVFAGSGSLSLTQQQIGLDATACAQLDVAWGQTCEFELCGGDSVFSRTMDRARHYWEHPVDAVRAAYKLGVLGCLLALKDEIWKGLFLVLQQP
jgi:hypothetical protein